MALLRVVIITHYNACYVIRYGIGVGIPVAHDTLLCCVVNVTVHVEPIDTDSGMSLGFLSTHVSLVDTVD